MLESILVACIGRLGDCWVDWCFCSDAGATGLLWWRGRFILVHPFICSRDLSMVNQRTRSRTRATEMSFLCRVSRSLDKWKIMAGWRECVIGCTSIWEVGEVKRPFLNYLKCNILQRDRLFKCANRSFQESTSQHSHHENRLHTTGWLNSNVTTRSVTALHDGWIRK